jgi:hypothetical protein
VSDDNIERVREAFQRSPHESMGRGSRELGMPKMAAWKMLGKKLCYIPYKMRLMQALKPADNVKRSDFARRYS